MDNIEFECKSSMDKRTRFKTALVFLLFSSVTVLIIMLTKKNVLYFPIIGIWLIYIIALFYGLHKTPIL